MSRQNNVKQQIKELYPLLKENGMFYMTIGRCISSDNKDSKENWLYNLHILEELLAGIPLTESKDIERVKQGIEIVRRELQKF